MPEESYYDLLQVQPTADWEIIEVAYRRLIRKYHPDVNRSSDWTKNLAWREVTSGCGNRVGALGTRGFRHAALGASLAHLSRRLLL